MNFNTRRIYSRKYQQLQKAMEVKYSGVVYRALRKQASETVADLRTYGIEAARITAGSHLFNSHIGAAIRRLYLDAGMVRASQVRAEMRGISMKKSTAVKWLDSNQLTSLPYGDGLLPQTHLTHKARLPLTVDLNTKDNVLQEKRASFGTNDELTHAIIDYLQRHLLDKSVRPISETTRNWILGIISKGVEEGLGAREIAREIEGSEFLKFQALRIVRTETVRATNIGAMKAAEASPYEVQKEWISANDKRTRFSHMLVDGEVQDFNNTFTNGLLQPGDPNASAAEVCNCRCSVAFKPKRDENDNLVMKPAGPRVEIIPAVNRIMNFLNTG